MKPRHDEVATVYGDLRAHDNLFVKVAGSPVALM
jgi:hypothetical protein